MHTFKKSFLCASVSLWWVLLLLLVAANLAHAQEHITS